MSELLTAQVTVTPARGKIVAAISSGQRVNVTNRDATNSIFVGSSTVTTTTGIEVKPGQSLASDFIDLPPEIEMYAICAAGTPRADVGQVIAD